MQIQAGILDPISDALPESLWDDAASESPKLKPQHKTWITETIEGVLEDAGYDNMDSWLSLVITGSLTTYQYAEDSDVDVSLFVDAEVFPEWSRAEMIGILVERVDGVILPGTTFPMQAFVVPPEVKREDLYQPGTRSGYEIETDEWIVPPERSRVRDVEKDMYFSYVNALLSADKMETLLTYWPEEAIEYWRFIKDRRRNDMKKGLGDFSESNIIYKFLGKRGLFPKISDLTGDYIAKTAMDWEKYYNMIEEESDPAQMGEMPWHPGNPGKCFVGDDGRVYSWNTDAPDDNPSVGVPHHTWMADQLGLKSMRGSGWIYPSGAIHFPYLDTEPTGEETLEYVVESIPGTWRWEPDDEPESHEWHFAGQIDPEHLAHRIDSRAVEVAARRLGLSNPVEVHQVGGNDQTYGQYTGLHNGKHQIAVVGWLKPESASRQIWHELAHARQAEQGETFEDWRGPDQGQDVYRNQPVEVEASEWAERNPFPLALPLDKTSAFGDPKYNEEGEWEDYEDWEPGWEGKGILYRNPHYSPDDGTNQYSIETWRVDMTGDEYDPGYHHYDMIERLSVWPEYTFQIQPNGQIEHWAGGGPNPNIVREQWEPIILDLDPRLKPSGESNNWNFARTSAIQVREQQAQGYVDNALESSGRRAFWYDDEAGVIYLSKPGGIHTDLLNEFKLPIGQGWRGFVTPAGVEWLGARGVFSPEEHKVIEDAIAPYLEYTYDESPPPQDWTFS